MQGCSLLLVYYFFKAWAHSRTSSPPKLQLFVDALFLLIYFVYLFFLLFLPLLVVSQVSLVCRIIILCEQVGFEYYYAYKLALNFRLSLTFNLLKCDLNGLLIFLHFQMTLIQLLYVNNRLKSRSLIKLSDINLLHFITKLERFENGKIFW